MSAATAAVAATDAPRARFVPLPPSELPGNILEVFGRLVDERQPLLFTDELRPVLQAADVAALCGALRPANSGGSGDDDDGSGAAWLADVLLPALALAARALARPPVSRFHVGAAALGSSGRIYLGGNVEFDGCPLSAAIHAEQFLCSNVLSAQQQQQGDGKAERLVKVCINEVPCGHCRQFFVELDGCHDIAFEIVKPGLIGRKLSLREILPFNFGPADLGIANGLTFAVAQPGATAAAAASTSDAEDGDDARLKAAATAALQQSWAPYSGCRSAVALLTHAGAVVAGAYVESAAYNPSLPPLMAAYVALLAAQTNRFALGYAMPEGGPFLRPEAALIRRLLLLEQRQPAVCPSNGAGFAVGHAEATRTVAATLGLAADAVRHEVYGAPEPR